jgi:hypothetical protein
MPIFRGAGFRVRNFAPGFYPSLALKGARPFGVPKNEATKSYIFSVEALMSQRGYRLTPRFPRAPFAPAKDKIPARSFGLENPRREK